MASASNYFPHYKLTKTVPKGAVLTTDEIITLVPGAKLVQMRSESTRIGINGGDAIVFKFGDEQALITGDTWVFAEQAEIAIGVIVNLLP